MSRPIRMATCHPDRPNNAHGLCRRCYQTSYRKARPGSRIGETLTRYGMGVEEYDKLLDAQGGVCAICKLPCVTGRRLAVDHDHSTGAVRGLLCAHCNTALGNFRDDPSLLMHAADYLMEHKQHDKIGRAFGPDSQGLP